MLTVGYKHVQQEFVASGRINCHITVPSCTQLDLIEQSRIISDNEGYDLMQKDIVSYNRIALSSAQYSSIQQDIVAHRRI